MDYLSADSIFVLIPEAVVPAESFYDSDFLSQASYSDLVHSTYAVLKENQLAVKEALKVWEIRLTLLLFNNQLSVAKKEAINLNNALYLQENPNATPPVSYRPSALTNSSGVSITEASLTSGGRRERSSSANLIYPLPKNNEGLIEYPLVVMLLRLRSVPNLALVNELYKLCYQIRLKGTSSEATKVQAKLISLSYEIIMVLTITRNYFTLLSYLDSLRHDVLAKVSETQYGEYYSNLTLMWIIINLLIRSRDKTTEEMVEISKEFQKDFDTYVQPETLHCLTHVLQTITPVIGSGDAAVGSEESVTLETIAEQISKKTITARIICCTLATWELSNVHTTELSQENGKVSLVVDAPATGDSKVDPVYSNVMSRWGENIHKVYGIE